MAALARSYEGARVGRRTEGWVVAGTSANAEIGTALARLRDRSRDLVRNNAYAAKATYAVVSNFFFFFFGRHRGSGTGLPVGAAQAADFPILPGLFYFLNPR